MDNKKYEIFWKLYNMFVIPKKELEEDDIKKEAFMEYAEIRENMIQHARELYAEIQIGADYLTINDYVQSDIEDGLIEENVVGELYDRYPDLEKYFDKRIYGDIHTFVTEKEKEIK